MLHIVSICSFLQESTHNKIPKEPKISKIDTDVSNLLQGLISATTEELGEETKTKGETTENMRESGMPPECRNASESLTFQ